MCLLPTAYCPLPTAYGPLPPAYCLLPTAYCLLPTAHCLLPTAHCLLPNAYCPLPTAPLPTAYYLLPSPPSLTIGLLTHIATDQGSDPRLLLLSNTCRAGEAPTNFGIIRSQGNEIPVN